MCGYNQRLLESGGLPKSKRQCLLKVAASLVSYFVPMVANAKLYPVQQSAAFGQVISAVEAVRFKAFSSSIKNSGPSEGSYPEIHSGNYAALTGAPGKTLIMQFYATNSIEAFKMITI